MRNPLDSMGRLTWLEWTVLLAAFAWAFVSLDPLGLGPDT
jgi:hypothetical protein